MTLAICKHDGERIIHVRHVADHDYEPADDEFIVDDETYHRTSSITDAKVDTSVDPPEIVERDDAEWVMEATVGDRTRDLIVDQFEAAGSNAISADGDIQANDNIPQEVKDFSRANIQLFYLLYVALTGERIQSVEDNYFPVS